MAAGRTGVGPKSIASREHPYFKGLVKLKTAHGRAKDGRFLVEGVRLAEEAVRAGLSLEAAIVADPVKPGERLDVLLAAAAAAGAELIRLPAGLLETLAETDSPQGVIIVARRPRHQAADVVRVAARPGPGGPPLVVILDGVQDPGNVGTILRTAEACAAGGVVAGPGTADPYQPKALRASMGAAFRVPMAFADDPAPAAEELRRAGLGIVATVAEGGRPLSALDLTGPVAVVFGSEGSGVSPGWLALVDRKGTITTPGPTESLNAAVAGSIVLYEILRQRGLT